MKEEKIIVLGGGASGMLCALRLVEGGKRNVTLIERNDRLGKKLSATGNGQGNLTNVRFGAEHYFSDDLKKVADVLNGFTDRDLLAYLEEKGGLFESDERGRVYPTGRQASAVTDLLRFALARAGVCCLFAHKIEKIVKEKGGFRLFDGEESFFADVLVMATGGKAAKNFGTDGTGYELLRALGHTVTPLYPALVQLKTDTAAIKGLRGIRTECSAAAIVGGKERARVRGDVIFTDYGVSGNAAFLLSSHLAEKTGTLVIDFLPDVSEEKIFRAICRKRDCAESELLGCIVNNQLGRAIVRHALKDCTSIDPIERKRKIAAAVKRFSLAVVGSLGFDYAQVTRGGVPMSEVNGNLESVKAKKLYLCGEVLNVDGECGGYNLQWAFSSAVRAANAICGAEVDR